MMSAKMVECGYLRVETEWQSKKLLDCEKKGSIKINAILYKFGHSLKVCSKTELRNLKYNKLYLPDVIEDGGVWKSKGRNRAVK